MFKKLLATSIFLVVSNSAFAAVTQYQISGTGSGSLNGVDFNNQAFTFTLVGNTDNLVSNSAYTAIDALDSATLSIQGLGTTSFTLPTRLGIAQGGGTFFSRAGDWGLDLFDFYTSLDYKTALTSNFTTTGTGVFALNQFKDVASSGGLVSFNSSSNVTFSSVAAVPEPETYALMGVGLLGLLAARRKAAKQDVQALTA